MNGNKHNKWAVLIGINHYRYSRTAGVASASFLDLRGAVEDVVDMRALLETQFGFDSRHILELIDGEATRSAILQALESYLGTNAGVDDIVVIHFSGHGSYKKLTDGQRVGTIVPHDSRGPGGSDITGRELNALLGQIKASSVTLVVDSCHSGNIMARGIQEWVRSVPPEAPELGSTGERGGRISSIRDVNARFALLAAAGPHESAYEMSAGGCHRGVFTYFFTEEVRRLGGNVTYRDIMDNVKGLVSSKYAFQNPQLEGALWNQFVFGDRASASEPYVRVWPETDARVRLDAGRIFGVTVGSRYAIYEPRTKVFSTQEPIAEARVLEVQPTVSFAEVVSGHSIPHASRAIEVEHQWDGLRTSVVVENADDLYERLKIHQHLEVRNGSSKSGAAGLRIRARDGLLFFELEALGSVVRKVELASGGAEREASIQAAEQETLHWAKWINVLHINNERVSWRLDFLTEPIGGKMPRASGQPVYYDDCQIRYRIHNRSGRDLFISLLAFGDDGSISVVYPTNGPSSLVMDNEELNDTLELEPLLDRESELNILKLFVTSQVCDFRFLELEHPRGSARGESQNPLEQLLDEAAWGARRVKVSTRMPDWLTQQRTIWVHRWPAE